MILCCGEALIDMTPIPDVRPDLSQCQKELLECSMQENHWPPVFDLTDAKGFSFESGKSELTLAFEEKLRVAIIPRIQEAIRNEGFEITVIEIIGHTDEVEVKNGVSNLDKELLYHLGIDADRPNLKPAGNAGLGLARATAVRKFLLQQGSFTDFTIIELSAAQGVE